MAALQGGLDREGIAIVDCTSKSAVAIAIGVLAQLGIPHLALFDGDRAGQIPGQAEVNRRLLVLCGEEPEDWPDRAVRATSANWEDTMESDLSSMWPEFAQARSDAADELGIKGDKKARVYREAVARAGEPPQFLLDVLDAVRELR